MRRADLLVKKFEEKDQTFDSITDETLIDEASSLVESVLVTVGDITLAKEPGSLKLASLLLKKKVIRELYENLRKEILRFVGDDVKTAAVMTSMAFKYVNQNEGAYDMEADHNVSNVIAKWRADERIRQKIDEHKKELDGVQVTSNETTTLPEEFFEKVSGGKSDSQKNDESKGDQKKIDEDHHEEKPKKKRTYTRRKKKDDPKKKVETKETDKVGENKEDVKDESSANTFVEPLPKVEKKVRIPATDSLLLKLREAENDPDSGINFQEDTDWCVDRDEVVFSEKMYRNATIKNFIENDSGENDEVIVAATTSLED